jgi:AraC family transcriptional regulator
LRKGPARDLDGTVGDPICNAGFRLTQAVYRDVPVLPSHSHPLARICLTMEGSFRETIDGRVCECSAGTVLLRPPGAPHDDRIAGPLRNVLIEIEPRRFEEVRGAFDRGFAPTLVRGAALSDVPARIERELRSLDTPASVSLEGLLLRLLADVSKVAASRRPPSGPPRFVEEAAAMIDRSFPAPLGLSVLARRVGVNPSRLAEEFRRHKQCSVGEYLRRRRVEFARKALGETSVSICAVAVEAGFADQAHLTREFRRALGVTPGAFRRGERPVSRRA